LICCKESSYSNPCVMLWFQDLHQYEDLSLSYKSHSSSHHSIWNENNLIKLLRISSSVYKQTPFLGISEDLPAFQSKSRFYKGNCIHITQTSLGIFKQVSITKLLENPKILSPWFYFILFPCISLSILLFLYISHCLKHQQL